MNMRKGLISICFGIILVAAAALNAQAQMCGCMSEKSGGMQEGGMMGGMMHGDAEHKDMPMHEYMQH
jgi:hypothetical protein